MDSFVIESDEEESISDKHIPNNNSGPIYLNSTHESDNTEEEEEEDEDYIIKKKDISKKNSDQNGSEEYTSSVEYDTSNASVDDLSSNKIDDNLRNDKYMVRDKAEHISDPENIVKNYRETSKSSISDTSADDILTSGKIDDSLRNSNYMVHEKTEYIPDSENHVKNYRETSKSSIPDTSSDDILSDEHVDDSAKQMSPSSSHGKSIIEETSSDEKSVVTFDSDSSKENNAENDIVMSFAQKEIGVNNIDPIAAQKRAVLVCKLEQLENQLKQLNLLLTTANIDALPDRGEKLRQSVITQEQEIQQVKEELKKTALVVTPMKKETFQINPNIFTKPLSASKSKEFGKQAQETHDKELSLTVDRLQSLHSSLVTAPTEDDKAEDPRGLKIKLMPHQQHALAWLSWREQQKPAGGVLADDMGLGKTLTMIALVLASRNQEEYDESDEDSDEETNKKKLRYKGGTIVVCPASLLSQWESEIMNRCKRGTLSVDVYHSKKRESIPKLLAKNDIVITTYNTLTQEFKTKSTVYKIHWKRAILDEAHVVRNHKTQASAAVCALVASKRWALTGTPIQNKETDLYAILKFLKCSPFDDLRVWKRWVDNKNTAGHHRLAAIMKTLMLRRTKQELQAKGALECLPDKCIDVIKVVLDPQEQLVYQKVLVYSRTLFAQFLAQKAEKSHMMELNAGNFDRPTFFSNPNKNTQFTKAQSKLLALHADVKSHEILVLLLRLRQICCHPALINAMLDQEDLNQSGIMDDDFAEHDLLSKMNKVTLEDNEDNEEDEEQNEIGVDAKVTANLLTVKNPVFEPNRISSKMKAVLEMVQEILGKGDKLIIVSQWSTMLDIVASHLSSIKGATYKLFSGKVPIKDRQGIMDSFNDVDSDPKILLLSLTAGGVGLNLVGGNHLLLIDIHWNPQLESQAQDRIYRFGQTKNVYIYKFICKDTIEERIQNLQDKKLELAQTVLSGDKITASSKLSLDDLKSLFSL